MKQLTCPECKEDLQYVNEYAKEDWTYQVEVLELIGYELSPEHRECAGDYNDLKGYLNCEIIPMNANRQLME